MVSPLLGGTFSRHCGVTIGIGLRVIHSKSNENHLRFAPQNYADHLNERPQMNAFSQSIKPEHETKAVEIALW